MTDVLITILCVVVFSWVFLRPFHNLFKERKKENQRRIKVYEEKYRRELRRKQIDRMLNIDHNN